MAVASPRANAAAVVTLFRAPASPVSPGPPRLPAFPHLTFQGVDSGSEIRREGTGLWAETPALLPLSPSDPFKSLR